MAKVFISHSSRDKRFVRTLKEDLNENGIDTWFDEDQLNFGDSLAEKLELSLEESTHFIIVLSSHSVNSEWVKFELNKAISQVGENLMSKIIPIKYGECLVPKDIQKLLYVDLSNEVVKIVGEKVDFITDGYPTFLKRLIRSLKSSENKKLTSSDKTKLKKEFTQTEEEFIKKEKKNAIMLIGVDGFLSIDSKNTFVNRITGKTDLNDSGKLRPILLPNILKNIFSDIQLGDILIIDHGDIPKQNGHFAGYRRDSIKVTIEGVIRRKLGLQLNGIYPVKFDGKTKTISFIHIDKASAL